MQLLVISDIKNIYAVSFILYLVWRIWNVDEESKVNELSKVCAARIHTEIQNFS